MRRHSRRLGFALGGLHLAALGSLLAAGAALWLPTACSVCGQYENATGIDVPVRVRLVNQTGKDFYVDPGQCARVPPFTLTDAAGRVHETQFTPTEIRCEAAMSDTSGCPIVAAECVLPPVTRVAPGGAYEVVWDGTVFDVVTLSGGCAGSAGCEGPCAVRRAPPGGALTLTGTAFPDCGLTPCACTPGPDGTCIVPGATGGGTPLEAKATLARVTSTTVDIVFH